MKIFFRSIPRTAILALLAGALLGGCGTGTTSYYSGMKRTVVDAKNDLMGSRPTTAEFFHDDTTPLIDINYDAADTLMGLFSPALNKNSPIYVQNFTNRVDMNDAAPFGPLVADQVASRLALRNFKVTEGIPKKPEPKAEPVSEPFLPPEGLALSGEEAKAADKRTWAAQNAPRPCLLTGTYLIADKVVYISARLTALDDGQVMAAHNWTVPVNRNTRALLPQLRRHDGMTPNVRTSLSGNPHVIARPYGQPDVYTGRDLVK